jgi:transposase
MLADGAALTCCARTIFSQPLTIAPAYGRETNRADSILLLIGQALGGRGSERLLCRLGIFVSDDTILRRLKSAAKRYTPPEPRIVGIDDWAQKKGNHYGTIMVDLERNCVVGLVANRSAECVAAWLALHPQVTTISRDRNGLYAQGARQAAPAATQVADRFHLVKNLREAVQRELSVKRHCLVVQIPPPPPLHPEKTSALIKAPAVERLSRTAVLASEAIKQCHEQKTELFAKVQKLRAEGLTVSQIARRLHWNRRRFDKWLKWGAVPERSRMEPRPLSAESFREYLWERWTAGCRNGRALLAEVRQLGYQGVYSPLALLLSRWRHQVRSEAMKAPPLMEETLPIPKPLIVTPVEPISRHISPQIAAALLGKPRRELTQRQSEIVDIFKQDCPGFAAMRTFTLSFRSILQNGNVASMTRWMNRANESGLDCLQQFARRLKQDWAAVEAAILQKWSNGPVEGQINRLKTLKRQMYGRAGIELLRARLLPLPLNETADLQQM